MFDQVWGMVSVDQIGGSLNRTVKNSAKNLANFFKGSKSPFTLQEPKIACDPNSSRSEKDWAFVLIIGIGALSLFLPF